MKTREFVAQVRKSEKGEFEIHIPDEAEKSENLKEGDYVKVTVRHVEKKGERTCTV